jgi:RIO kinase 1
VLQHEPERAAPAWLTAGGTEDEVLGLLKTGKEAEVFIVERRTLDGRHRQLLVHKRYRPTRVSHKGELEALGFTKARSFANDAKYHEGRKLRRSRDTRAVERGSALGRQLVAERWPEQEMEAVQRAHAAGVHVPYPVERSADGLLLQLLGDDGVAAPRLVDARLDAVETAQAFDQLWHELVALTSTGMVHADLSPYNVLWWRGQLWVIDLPQAVDLVQNPHGFDLLHHDVATMCTWFTRRGVDCDADEVFAALLSEAL